MANCDEGLGYRLNFVVIFGDFFSSNLTNFKSVFIFWHMFSARLINIGTHIRLELFLGPGYPSVA